MANNVSVYQQVRNVSIPKKNLKEIAIDPTLSKKDLRVLLLLFTELDGWNFATNRKIKDPFNFKSLDVKAIAKTLNLEKKEVKSSITNLINEGYLDIGDNDTVKDGYRFTF